jgi:hypothetical protein
MGPKAIAEKKTLAGRKLDWIGWEIDLDTQTVRMAEHCFLKTAYLYFSIDA